MKTLKALILMAVMAFIAPLATAAIYAGSWTNKTFGSTGPLTIRLDITKTKVSGNFNLDGPVFGGINPPPIPFNVPLKSNGSGTFNVIGTLIGDIAGSFTSEGKLTIAITNVPGGTVTDASFNGSFDLTLEKFTGTYNVNGPGGPLANGVTEAHVPKAPTVKLARKVNISGSSGSAKATVLTNTTVASVTATTTSGTVRVKLVKPNVYRIIAKQMTAATTKVTVVVTNADGFKTTKVVRFVKT